MFRSLFGVVSARVSPRTIFIKYLENIASATTTTNDNYDETRASRIKRMRLTSSTNRRNGGDLSQIPPSISSREHYFLRSFFTFRSIEGIAATSASHRSSRICILLRKISSKMRRRNAGYCDDVSDSFVNKISAGV